MYKKVEQENEPQDDLLLTYSSAISIASWRPVIKASGIAVFRHVLQTMRSQQKIYTKRPDCESVTHDALTTDY